MTYSGTAGATIVMVTSPLWGASLKRSCTELEAAQLKSSGVLTASKGCDFL